MTTITMRIMRFLLLCTTAWAAQWQQTPYNAPPVYAEARRVEQHPSASHYSSPSDNNAVLTSTRQAGVPQEQAQEIDPDIIKLEHVSLSLRLTCEVNRRLLSSIRNNNNPNVGAATNSQQTLQTSNTNPLLQRGGDNDLVNSRHYPVNIHPSQSWQPPICNTAANQDEEQLTVFHAKSPKPHRRGVARWGPDLTSFLDYVMGLLNIPTSQRSIVMALALVYLDRACSVETVRSSGANKCPYCTPQTVHRLVLVALLTATRAVMGNTLETDIVVEKLGIPFIQLEQMQQAFLASLGDVGVYVDSAQLQRFLQMWNGKFNRGGGNVQPVMRQSMTPAMQPQQPQWA